MKTTNIDFRKHGINLLVDRQVRAAFLMDYENLDFLGSFDVHEGQLFYHPTSEGVVPQDIVDTVRSMLCHQGART